MYLLALSSFMLSQLWRRVEAHVREQVVSGGKHTAKAAAVAASVAAKKGAERHLVEVSIRVLEKILAETEHISVASQRRCISRRPSKKTFFILRHRKIKTTIDREGMSSFSSGSSCSNIYYFYALVYAERTAMLGPVPNVQNRISQRIPRRNVRLIKPYS